MRTKATLPAQLSKGCFATKTAVGASDKGLFTFRLVVTRRWRIIWSPSVFIPPEPCAADQSDAGRQDRKYAEDHPSDTLPACALSGIKQVPEEESCADNSTHRFPPVMLVHRIAYGQRSEKYHDRAQRKKNFAHNRLTLFNAVGGAYQVSSAVRIHFTTLSVPP